MVKQPARLVVADDHESARASMRRLLSGEHGFEIVAEAADGAGALALSRSLHPDLMLVDLQMPDLDGLAVTRAVKYEFPAIRVLVVTMDSAPGRLLSALHAGADGYVLKGCSKHELIETVRAALDGRPRVQPEVAAFLMQIIASGKETGQTMFSERPNRLECEILELSAQGLPPTAIARKLGLEAAGLTSHIVQLLAKLGIDRLRCRRRLVREGAEAPGDSCTLDRMRQLGS